MLRPNRFAYGSLYEALPYWGAEAALALRARQPSVTEVTGGVYALKPLEELPEPLHLFFTLEDAEAWYGDDVAPGYSAWHYVIRAFEERVDPESPECNELWVTGLDRASMQPIKAFWRDDASQDGRLQVALRPENWLGEPLLFGYWSSALASQGAVVRAVKTLVPRMTNPRYIADASADLVRWPDGRPLWRGDLVAIPGRGYYIVRSFGGEVIRTAEHRSVEDEGDATQLAEMRYTLERLYPWEGV